MFKTLSKYSGKTVAAVANTTANVAKATPSYLGEVSKTFKEEFNKGYTEKQQACSQKK